MPRTRTGTFETATFNGLIVHRGRLHLADGTRSRRFDLPSGMAEKQARAYLAGLQAEEDVTHQMFHAKQDRLRAHGAQVDGETCETPTSPGTRKRARARASGTSARNERSGASGFPKGGKELPVPMSPALRVALRKLLASHAHEYVLTHDDGSPLTWRAVTWIITKCERLAGLPLTGQVHVLKHTYCTSLSAAGVAPGRTRWRRRAIDGARPLLRLCSDDGA